MVALRLSLATIGQVMNAAREQSGEEQSGEKE